jgi:myo-inositol 2-dehydrogenase/D-chiro-inositol 1-dehydrogenase
MGNSCVERDLELCEKYGYDYIELRLDNDRIGAAMGSAADGVTVAKPLWFFLERYNDAFVAEAQAFTDAVLSDKAPPITGADGLAPVLIALAAGKSFKEGRPVKISEIQ